MKTLVKVFILLFLLVAVFGGAGWYAYNLYLKPQKVVKSKVAAAARPSATPDRSAADYEALVASFKGKPRGESIAALQKFLTDFPSSKKAPDARKLLGDLNIEEFFSRTPGPNKTEYVVVPGDSLARISSKNKVSFDLIIRANNIDRLLIHPGDRFLIPTGEFSIEISAKDKVLTLKDRGSFFKEYPLMVANLPSNVPPEGVEVTEKIAWHDGKRVAFGDKNYVGSSRWISLSNSGLNLYSVIEDGSPVDVDPPGSGAQLSPGDLEEIFALVNRGTPVTILP
ncbi:MAG TPA: LysM peptidoglycan-binding domain-containing protein [Chthoniobacterales bacterium]|jgi:LysM repeat protein